jgi:hypothetical protein
VSNNSPIKHALIKHGQDTSSACCVPWAVLTWMEFYLLLSVIDGGYIAVMKKVILSLLIATLERGPERERERGGGLRTASSYITCFINQPT